MGTDPVASARDMIGGAALDDEHPLKHDLDYLGIGKYPGPGKDTDISPGKVNISLGQGHQGRPGEEPTGPQVIFIEVLRQAGTPGRLGLVARADGRDLCLREWAR